MEKDILLAYERRPKKFPIDLHIRLWQVRNVFRNVRWAREAILANRHEGKGRDLTAYMLDQYEGDEQVAYAVLRAGHYAARRRLDYWGLTGDDDQWWCSYCKQIKPLSKFDDRTVACCHDCRESRRASRNRSKKSRFRYSERVNNG
jgi:hypothetical protein